MTAVNGGPALTQSPNMQSQLVSKSIISVALGTGPYDLDRTNLPGYVSGGCGVIKIQAAAGNTTINSLSAVDAPNGSIVTFINTGTVGSLLFNNLGATGNLAPYGFQNMNGGQVAIYPGGAGSFMRVIPAGGAQGYWVAI